MNFKKSLSIFFAAGILGSCAWESPELIPCACNNLAESDLGWFNCLCGSDGQVKEKKRVAKKQEVRRQEPRKQVKQVKKTVVRKQEQVYRPETVVVERTRRVAPAPLPYCDEEPVVRKNYTKRTFVAADVEEPQLTRDDLASLKLEYVDFRLENGGRQYDTKLGDYRFRIFGCRRESRNVFLNQGRAMEKDMRFFDIFFENMNELYPVVVDRNSHLYEVSDRIRVPEYLLTAEIVDYHMNICDEFDWNNTQKKNTRTGSSEITIVWRLMDLCKTHVYWKGMTTGYGEVMSSEPNGETLLVERAFSDALKQLPYVTGFEDQMTKRVSPEDLMAQQRCWDTLEQRAETFQCEYKKEISYAADEPVYYESPCIEEKSSTRATNYVIEDIIEEDGGAFAEGRSFREEIEERGGSNSKGSVFRSEIKERGGSVSSGESFKPVKPKENLAFVEDYWVDVPLDKEVSQEVIENREIVEDALMRDKNSLCIMAQRPYNRLTPETLYRVRASIVEVSNPSGKKGSGLLISDQFILTSADLLNKNNNRFDIRTINGKEMAASAFRVNPNKNVALLLLDNKTQYKPLPLTLDLPEVNKDVLMTLGMKDLAESEGYLDSNARVTGYRYSPERGAEIMVSTRVQNQTLGGALLDKNANIVGMAHAGKRMSDGPDLFIPIETAMKALDLTFCNKPFVNETPWEEEVKPETPVATAIDTDKTDKAPVPMDAKEAK